MGWTRDFLEGFAQVLETAGVADWDVEADYTADQVGIYLVGIPDGAPSGLALAHYVVDDTLHGHGVQGLQVRCRGTEDPRVAADLADAVFDALHGLTDAQLPGAAGITVAKAWRQSHAPIGTDSAGRWETSSNFYALTDRPQQHPD